MGHSNSSVTPEREGGGSPAGPTKENNAHCVEKILSTLASGKAPKVVRLWFYLWRVFEVDTVNETYTALLTVSAAWEEPKPTDIIEPVAGETRWTLADLRWNPQIRFTNIIEEDADFKEEWIRVYPSPAGVEQTTSSKTSMSKQHYLEHGCDGPVCIVQSRRFKAKFTERMELQRFPFDLQHLHVWISSTWSHDMVLLSFSKNQPCNISPLALVSAEWVMSSPRLVAFDMDWQVDDLPLLSSAQESITGARYSKAYIGMTVARQPMFYVWNVWMMLLILGTLSLAVFSIPVEDVADRLSNLLTLVLALVAFKLVLASSLPAIGYLTLMDIFTLGAVWLMFSVGLGIAVLPTIAQDDEQLHLGDTIIFWFCTVVWVGMILVSVMYMWFLSVRRQQRVKQIDQEFRKQASEQRQRQLQEAADLFDFEEKDLGSLKSRVRHQLSLASSGGGL